MDAYGRLVGRHAVWVLAATVALTALAVHGIVDLRTGVARLHLDPSVDSLLPEDDEHRREYDAIRTIFGSDEALVVALFDPNGIFLPGTLETVVRLTRRLETLEGVHHVLSLSNALDIRGVDGDLEIEPFLRVAPTTPDRALEIRRRALSNPVYAGNLVSRDGRATAILVHLQDMPESELLAMGIDERIRAAAREEARDLDVWIAGGTLVKTETSRILQGDLLRIVPLCVLLMAVIAGLSFRSGRGVFVPLSTILISLLWSLGLIALLGESLNIVTVVIPPLILVVGFAYAVHVVSETDHEWIAAPPGADARDVAGRALGSVALPVLLTGITTAAGFLSLTISTLGAIRQFGTFATIGVLCTMIASLTWAPGVLAVLRSPGRRSTVRVGRTDRWLLALGRFDLRHRRLILLAGGALAGASILAMTRIDVSTDLVSNFSPETALRTDYEAVNEHLEGAGELIVVLRSDYPDAFLEPANLRHVFDLQRWFEQQEGIGGSTSLVDYLMLINRGFHDDDPEYLAIPETRQLARQLLFFGANDEIDRFVDSRYQTLGIRVRSQVLDSGEVARLVSRIEERLAALPPHIRGRVTGNAALVARTIDDIAYGQAISLGTAFLIIYAILSLLFTSFRIGFIALIPNALPVVVYFGLLGVSGVTLNVTTGLVACLVLGIAVDDTVHLMSRFNQAAREHADEGQGVLEALRSVGRPVTYTSFALAAGFLVLTTANLRNQVEFGALASATLVFAWIIDITFTPALAARMKIVTLWDVLALDLGESPHRSIPLFRGLSQVQARIVALMADVRSHPAGHVLFRVGDAGDDMYIVIEGSLAASIEGPDGRVALSKATRGDVSGEVALFYGSRTAEVVAETDVRLIRLTLDDLNRLKRRYPRIAATIFRNLSDVLAHRLSAATVRVR